MGLAEELEQAAAAVRQRALPAVVGIGSHGPLGSGVVYAEGAVVSSAHNVRTEHPLVSLEGGAAREAESVSLDRAGDLALIRVDTAGAQPLEWAPAAPRLGSPVFAAANPGGRGVRLSFGVVAGLDREFRGPGGRPISGSLEHTAPLPHGSSGGPVLDLGGRLLGLNTKRLGEGLYAAIVADSGLRERLQALSRGEPLERPYLGVGLLPAEAARRLRQAVGLPQRNGVLVQQLDPEGPAAAAGLRQGDLIGSAGGVEIVHTSDLHRALASHRPGQQLALRLVRGVEELELSVTLGAEPERRWGAHPRP